MKVKETINIMNWKRKLISWNSDRGYLLVLIKYWPQAKIVPNTLLTRPCLKTTVMNLLYKCKSSLRVTQLIRGRARFYHLESCFQNRCSDECQGCISSCYCLLAIVSFQCMCLFLATYTLSIHLIIYFRVLIFHLYVSLTDTYWCLCAVGRVLSRQEKSL